MLPRSILLVGLLSVAAGCNGFTGVDDLEIAPGPAKPACTYPTKNLGTQFDQVPPPDLEWAGYAGDPGERVTVSIQDYLDCDGSKGINALIIEQSAGWCPPCQGESIYMEEQLEGDWQGLGIQVLVLLVEDFELHKPATAESARKWRTELDIPLPHITAAMDPHFTFAPDGEDAYYYPTSLLVDPRTMKITAYGRQAIVGAAAFAQRNKTVR